jgi:hypothetical protein
MNWRDVDAPEIHNDVLNRAAKAADRVILDALGMQPPIILVLCERAGPRVTTRIESWHTVAELLRMAADVVDQKTEDREGDGAAE